MKELELYELLIILLNLLSVVMWFEELAWYWSRLIYFGKVYI